MQQCGVCGSDRLTSVYTGPIRMGRFGDLSAEDHDVLACEECGTRWLPALVEDAAAYYESDAYRTDVDASAEAAHFLRVHAPEQARHLAVTGTDVFRDAVVADVGCGAGAFLDAVAESARELVAIEPSETFRASMRQRGYATYPYATDALAERAGTVDVAVTFAVVEHVDDPLAFLTDIRRLLKPGGRLFLSTPNAEDFLLEALPEEYARFFYRKVHRTYFGPEALAGLLRRAGLADVRVIPVHRFGLGNALGWLRDRRPTGESRPSFVTPAMDEAWRAELERAGRSDFLYAEARV